MKKNKYKKGLMLYLILISFLLKSCSVIYKAPYYVPNDTKNWSYNDRLKSYTHPRYYMSSRMDIQNGDTTITKITFGHLHSNFGSGAKAKWTGIILPIIPQISFNHKREKIFNSEIEIDLNTTILLDTSKFFIIFNEKYSQKPNKSEMYYPSILNGYYHYRLNLYIKNEEVLKNMKSIKLNFGETKMKWLDEIIFIRKNKSVWFMTEGIN